MHHIYAPWRMAYLTSTAPEGCVFCERGGAGDDSHVVSRSAHVYTILNAYPYTPGHLMVCPYRHVGRFGELEETERGELLRDARRASAALRRAYRPESIHIGANVGRPAGAGVVGHFHLHLVPIRAADRLDDPRREAIAAMPEPLEETARRVRAALGAA
jgi:ATP adenylyltransferase